MYVGIPYNIDHIIAAYKDNKDELALKLNVQNKFKVADPEKTISARARHDIFFKRLPKSADSIP